MKKLLNGIGHLVLLLPILLSNAANGQTTIQLGSGALWGNAIPINTDYYYSYTQTIYKQSEMNAAGATTPGIISKIRYKTVNVNPSATWDYWTVYIGHTTVDSFVSQADWVPVNTLTEVYEASLPLINVSQANSWMELTLSTPFHWNGTDNIVIAVDENRPLGNIQWQYWQAYQPTTGAGYGRGLYYGTDFQNPDPASPPAGTSISATIPQIQFEFTSDDATLPVSFGSVSAQQNSSILLVKWQTLSERNVDHFNIVVSRDGKNFTSVGESPSLSPDGNSSEKLEYSFSVSTADVNGKVGLASVSVLFIISLLLIFVNRRNKMLFSGALALTLGLPGLSCSKHRPSASLNESGKLFVRIEQIDKDGAKSLSTVIQAHIDR